MKADVTIIPAAPRTYAVPKAVSSFVATTLNTPSNAASHTTVTDLDIELAKKLAIDTRITADDAFSIHTGLTASASSALSFNLRGGSEGRDWAAKIVEGIRRDELRVRDTTLEQIGYAPDEFHYFGLSDRSDQELLRAVGRIPVGECTLNNADVLTASGDWQRLSESAEVQSAIDSAMGTALEPSLLASSASAFTTGFQAVYLSYLTPLCFLDNIPLLASGIPEGMTKDSEFIYAVVDPTDTTAVISLILLKPGPQAYIRTGGNWTIDEPTLDSLLSASPPPIVELSGATAASVVAQVDASQAQQVAPDVETGAGGAGEGLENGVDTAEAKPKKSNAVQRQKKSGGVGSEVAASEVGESPNGSMPPKDAMAASGRNVALREVYENGMSIVAAMRARDGDTAQVQLRELRIRTGMLRTAAALREQALSHINMLENVIVPVVAAAPNVVNTTPNQRKAEPMRKYWLRGAGAVRIMWGVPGDFNRCRTLLTPYLGARSAGYCAKLHHSATGGWPGHAPTEEALKKGTDAAKKSVDSHKG